MQRVEITLPVSIFKEGNNFVAYTPALDISTHGATLEESKKAFDDLVLTFFEELARKGTTNEVLTSLGWEKVDHNWTAPPEIEHRIESFQVPVGA